MAIIKVPKTPKTAFDTGRPASKLLLAQIKHLEWAVLPASQRTRGALPKQSDLTEGQAAERIAALTKMVLAAATARTKAGQPVASAPPGPIELPPLPPAPRRAPRARKAASRRTASARKPAPKRDRSRKLPRRTRGRS